MWSDQITAKKKKRVPWCNLLIVIYCEKNVMHSNKKLGLKFSVFIFKGFFFKMERKMLFPSFSSDQTATMTVHWHNWQIVIYCEKRHNFPSSHPIKQLQRRYYTIINQLLVLYSQTFIPFCIKSVTCSFLFSFWFNII